MSNDEAEALWETLSDVGKAVSQAQAFNRANNAILMEVVCTENPIRVDDVMESPKLAE